MQAMAQERIISADSHVTIREEAVLEHLAKRLHDDYKQCKVIAMRRFLGDDADEVRNPEQPGFKEADHETWEAAGRPGAWDPHERLKDMDIDKVDAEVLYSDAGAGATLYHMPGGTYLEAFQAFNSAAIDFASVNPDRLIPVYLIPIADIDEAVKEVQRVANEGARAVQVPQYPTDLGFPGYWDERYDPLWAALQDLQIPISQHVGGNGNLARIRKEDPTLLKGITHALPPIFMAENLAFWIVTGILERFPRLQVVLVEAGLGWIPYFLGRLDKVQVRHGWNNFEMLKEKPSTYFHRQMAVTFEEDEFGIRNRDDIGVENLMWATDYPHPDSTWPHSQEVISTHFDGVPIAETRKMVAGNAARFYNL
jgi:uncharacterized protein